MSPAPTPLTKEDMVTFVTTFMHEFEDRMNARSDAQFAAVTTRLHRHDELFEKIHGRLETIQGQLSHHDDLFGTVQGQLSHHDRLFGTIQGQLEAIQGQLNHHDELLETIQDQLSHHDDLLETIVTEVSDVQNTLAPLIPEHKNHEERIVRLERGYTRLILKH